VNAPAIIAQAPALQASPAAGGRPAASETSFGSLLASMVDDATEALDRADGMAGAVAQGGGDVVAASVARAKADVILQAVAVTAARASGALNSLLQTQV
jgi:flagellar hook-basal body complex protein FliE